MTVDQLRERMRGWLTSGAYRAVLFEENGQVAAYALFSETDTEIYLRQLFHPQPSTRGVGSPGHADTVLAVMPKT